MSVEYDPFFGAPQPANTQWGVTSETARLTDVLLAPPSYLAPVPCCSVTRESLREGFTTSTTRAVAQHRALIGALERHGVRCHALAPHHEMPDLCFTRDAAVMTPWGLLGLNPAAEHRSAETAHVLAAARAFGVDVLGRIERGTAEGGDIAVVRPGLVVIGCSGERTCEAGAEEVAEIFRSHGWEAVIYHYDPHFLHLDTQFSMAADGLALACVDVLDDRFIDAMRAKGVTLIPVSYKEARRLGCNVLSVGRGVVLAAADQPRVTAELEAHGLIVDPVEIDEFTRCGGGVHCLTLPLARAG